MASALPPPEHHHHLDLLSPLEQEILDEYYQLLVNLHNISFGISRLAAQPVDDIMDNLRALEGKAGLVFALLKSSVYQMVLLQEGLEEPEEEH